MEKRNWKHIVTLKQRMVLCLAAFFAAFALQLALNGYQARAVQQVQDDQMGNFNATVNVVLCPKRRVTL